ncbi:MAG: hypothetical protein LPK19_12845 [Hymenobacteraceae bacterium]|nr:hypothetical protein [Hymenobacteraceae bacterium]MDX5397109.1 hypothetical protein [Hymenobacteraceae bacterium]MDX5513187.1 hypothetical protein [Hymenobacteraceae bacterium]
MKRALILNVLPPKKNKLLLRALLFVGISLCSFSTIAQSGRFLQKVDLRDKQNKPYFSDSHSLPVLAVKGVEAGQIKPYLVDYSKNTVKPLSLPDFQFDFYTDNLDFYPERLTTIELDLVKAGNKVKKINYVHFYAKVQRDSLRYFFSVPFSELSAYLNKQNSLWVKNSNPLIWKNQILHTDGNVVQSA